MKSITIFVIVLFVAGNAIGQQSCNNFCPEFSPDGTTLLFCSDRDGTFHIYKSHADGSNIQRLTSNDFEEWAPRYSPDGSKIVFYSGPYGNSAEIYIMNSDGSGQVKLTENSTYDGSPAFSPDGTRIVFDGYDNESYPEIFIMNADGTGRTQLTNVAGAYHQSAPQFHPSGQKIYFMQGFNADNHILMMDPDGSNWVDVTPPNDFGYNEATYDLNSDGSKIVFSTANWVGYNGPLDIVIANADGSDWQRLTDGPGGDQRSYYPIFNPAGNQIVFCNDRYNSSWVFDLFTMGTDGSNKNVIVTCSDAGVGENNHGLLTLYSFPNPVSDRFKIVYNAGWKEEVVVWVTDCLGKSLPVDIKVEDDGISVHLQGFNSGIYGFVVMEGNAYAGGGRFIIP